MIGLGIVVARLDYCNLLLYGTFSDNLWKLQVTANALARVVCQAARTCSATELRRTLHWLPVKQRIDYKFAVLTYKTRQSGRPSYLASLTLISDYAPFRSLRLSYADHSRWLKLQEWTKRKHVAGVDNAGVSRRDAISQVSISRYKFVLYCIVILKLIHYLILKED